MEDLEGEIKLKCEFSMSSADIVAAIEELETGGHFSGIWINDARDGRSFVRASLDELVSIASFISDKGRLTVEQVAIETNRVLGIYPSPAEPRGGGEGGEVDAHVSDGAEEMTRGGVTGQVARVDTPACQAATSTDALNTGFQEDGVSSQSVISSAEVANPGSLRRRH